jgi:hypothetical protein
MRTKSDWQRIWTGGLAAGLAGGIVLSVLMLVSDAIAGRNVWLALKGAGAPFLGARARAPGFDYLAIVVGFGSHLLVSVIWGVLFAVVVYGLPKTVTVAAGALWGLVVWISMYFVVLPIVGMGAYSRHAPVGPAMVAHVLFGLVVAIAFLPSQRTRVRRELWQP